MGGCLYGRINNVPWVILLHHLCYRCYHINPPDETNLHYLWLQIVEDGFYLFADDGSRQIVKLLNAQCILNGYRSNN